MSWTSQQSLEFRVTPDLALEPGLYDVQVDNRSGGTGTAAGALLVVPPPTVTRVQPLAICTEANNSVLRIEGDFFLEIAGNLPVVTVGTTTFVSTPSDCRTLPGTLAARACRTLEITIPRNAFPAGELELVVTNPTPAACRTTGAALKITVVVPPTLTSVAPLRLCAGGGGLTLTGTGFREGAQARHEGSM